MSVESSFERVRNFLMRFNAFDFLSQFSMTYLFLREDVFVAESDESHHNFRALEFACGLYGAIGFPNEGETVRSEILEEYRTAFRAYMDAVDLNLLTSATSAPEPQASSLLVSAKLHSLHVRGDAYPHQFWYLTEAVYAPHNVWFRNHLGFTISEAIHIAKYVEGLLNDRYAARKENAKKDAQALVIDREREWKQAGMTEKQAFTSAAAQLFFGQAKELYRLSVKSVSSDTGLSIEVCTSFFKRLSQTPPFRNPLFPNTFTDALTAPWNYNLIKERPFFSDGEDYWLFIPHTLKEVLYSTFFFDLMADASYRGTFENSRGQVLEELAAHFLERSFPRDAILLNPSYPNGEEFADVCVLFDSKIVIVQCKSKGLTQSAHNGEDRAALKRDLQKAIGNAAAQASKGRAYLERDIAPALFIDGRKIEIDKSKINEIVCVTVTYMPLQMFATRLREVETDLGMARSEYPVWALSIGDLDLVTEVCQSPAKLLHYVRRRLMLEEGEKSIHGDEMDLLAFYLDQGLWLRGGEMDESDAIGVAGYSGSIDEFVFQRYWRGMEVAPPAAKRAEGFDNIIADIESLASPNRTDCALMLLDLSGEASATVVELIQRTKERCLTKHESIPSSMGHDTPPWGMSIVASPKSISPEEAFNRTQAFARLKKYARRLPRWTALGWREGSTRSIDYALWLEAPFAQDPAMDALVKRSLA